MKTYGVAAAIAALSAGCGWGPRSGDLSKLSEQFVYNSLALSPVSATAAGYHEHNGIKLDQQIDDFSARAMENQRRFYTDFRDRLDQAASGEISAEDRADYTLMRDQIALNLVELNTIQSYRHNPTVYVELAGNALYSPYVLEYAPKPQRFRDIIARLQKIPRLLDQAKANLVDAPEVWTRVAQEENDGNIALIDVTLRRDCPNELKQAYEPVAAGAITALREFNNWLRSDLALRNSDWRLGKEKYALKFRYALETGNTPEEMLADAEAQLKSIRAHMAEIAKPDTVEAALDKIAKKHATPETYFDEAKHDLDETTVFVRDHHLLTLPARSNLQVIPTPEFMRGIYGVGGFSPAPALEPKLGAFYWITPIPPNWPADRIESKLREYNFYGLKILTVHEAMPGHYVQAEYANDIQPQSRRLVRAIFSNGPYVEGWAVYATQMMIDNGYYQNDPGMQLNWGKQLLRVVANTIIDIRFHTMNLTEQEALDLMIKDTYQEREEATAKIQRAQLSSCQLPTYFAGWRGWLAVRTAYEQGKGSSYQLSDFHERALKEGAVALPSLVKLLAGK
jgi:uncharacterized protein (DUF885 family)